MSPEGLPDTFACKYVTMASSDRLNLCSRTSGLKPVFATLMSAKSKSTRSERMSPRLSAAVFGYSPRRVNSLSLSGTNETADDVNGAASKPQRSKQVHSHRRRLHNC